MTGVPLDDPRWELEAETWAAEVNRRFLDRAWQLARRQIAPYLRRHFGPTDVASVSVLKLIRRVRAGGRRVPDAEFARLLRVIVRRTAIDHARKARRANRGRDATAAAPEVADPRPLPDEGVVASELAARAVAWINAQPDPTNRFLATLRLVEGRSYPEIADLLARLAADPACRLTPLKSSAVRLRLNALRIELTRHLGSGAGE